MSGEHWKDRLMDGLLREIVGEEAPPDLSAQLVARAFPLKKQNIGKILWATGIAAALLVAVSLFMLWPRYPALRAEGDYAVAGGGRLERGAILSTQEGAGQLELGGYATLHISPNTTLQIEGDPYAEAVYLQRGEISCDVKREVGTFEVKSDVGMVSVTGTQFTVRILEEEGGEEMSLKRMLVTVTAGAVLVAGTWGQTMVYAGEDATLPDSGTVVGLLTAKDKAWVAVKEDSKLEPRRYLAEWKGGSPENGGGPDAAMVETIKKLIVPNRVRLEWKFDEHPRVLKIEMIIPEKKEGVTEGLVTALGDNWVEVTPNGGVANRYWPRWIGGMPKDGGGLDQDMVRAIRALKKGQKVRVEWKYEERLRVLKVEVLEPPVTVTE